MGNVINMFFEIHHNPIINKCLLYGYLKDMNEILNYLEKATLNDHFEIMKLSIQYDNLQLFIYTGLCTQFHFKCNENDILKGIATFDSNLYWLPKSKTHLMNCTICFCYHTIYKEKLGLRDEDASYYRKFLENSKSIDK